MTKFHAFTYGFFEPLFFIGLGLYFVQITPVLLLYGVAVFAAALGIDSAVGGLSSRIFKVDPWRNAFGTCVKGGVDATLLVTALAAGIPLIAGFTYSVTAIAIALLSLTTPLLFTLRAPIIKLDKNTEEKGIVRKQLNALNALEISKILPTLSIDQDDPVKMAMKKCLDADSRAIIVVNHERKPIGTFLLRDSILLSNRQLRSLKISHVELNEPVTVLGNEPGLAVANLFTERNIPIIGVVDDEGKLIGTVLENEILKRIVSSVE